VATHLCARNTLLLYALLVLQSVAKLYGVGVEIAKTKEGTDHHIF
jgi:hypothetical protein